MVGIRTIVKDWNPYFPILKSYTPSTLFVRADFMLMGLRFRSHSSEYYTVHLNFIPLWDEKALETLRPVLVDTVKYMKVYYKGHERSYTKAIEQTTSQFGQILRPDISLSVLLTYIDKFADREIQIRHNPLFTCYYLILKIALATYFDDRILIQKAKDEIEEEVSSWDSSSCNIIFKKTPNQWKEDLYQRFDDRKAFMERIRRNSELPKVAALNEAHIVYDLAPDSKFLRPTSQPGSIARLLAKILRRK